MKDIWIGEWCLRVFWRGWMGLKRPLPYFFHKWGFYAFGVLTLGCMLWPPKESL